MVIVPFISASNSSERHYYQRLLEFLCTLANFSGHRRQNLNSLSGDESVKEEGGSVQALLLIRPISQMSDRPIIIGTRPHTKVTTELKKNRCFEWAYHSLNIGTLSTNKKRENVVILTKQGEGVFPNPTSFVIWPCVFLQEVLKHVLQWGGSVIW